jgi:hypothetical protein
MSVFGLLFGLTSASAIMIPGCIAPALISYFFQLQSLINLQAQESDKTTLSTSPGMSPREAPPSTTQIPSLELLCGQGIVLFQFGCVLILSFSSQQLQVGLLLVTIALIGEQ